MTERTARLDHLLREEISAIIRREIADPRIGFVTVTEVDVAPDLGHATVWVSAIGTLEERRATLRALDRAMPFVRHHLGALRLKRIPQLHLREDDSIARGTRVMHLLGELEAGVEEPGAAGLAELPTPGPARSDREVAGRGSRGPRPEGRPRPERGHRSGPR